MVELLSLEVLKKQVGVALGNMVWQWVWQCCAEVSDLRGLVQPYIFYFMFFMFFQLTQRALAEVH